MSGSDPEKMEQLPDTTGLKHHILIQKNSAITTTRYSLFSAPNSSKSAMKTAQPKPNSKPPFQIRPQPSTITPRRPGRRLITRRRSPHRPRQRDTRHRRCSKPGLSPRNHAKISRHGCRSDRLRRQIHWLVSLTGILCGRKDLIDAAFLHSFIGYETSPYDTIGRPLKVDRQEVIAVVVALREWFSMDHEARLSAYKRKAEELLSNLERHPPHRSQILGRLTRPERRLTHNS